MSLNTSAGYDEASSVVLRSELGGNASQRVSRRIGAVLPLSDYDQQAVRMQSFASAAHPQERSILHLE
jgi:hypothetical protein